MHPRNIYNDAPPNFAELADAVPSLKPFIKVNKKGGPTIDFKNPEALRTLTKALLLRGFGRNVYLPEDRLCPTVAGRLDYVLYLQDVIHHHRKVQLDFDEISATNESIVGLDIGVGASAIYPLLFTAVDTNVKMIGTDINEKSLHIARQNVERNNLQDRIAIMQVAPEAGFFDEVLHHASRLDFTMCNPPFYVSDEEMQQLTADKELPPHATCTGAPNEMITQGGEVAFVAEMIRQSQKYKDEIVWYSSLLGRATSITSLVRELASIGCHNYGLIESSPSHTHRWILLWSWTDVRLPDSISRGLPVGSPLTKSLPQTNELSYSCPASTTYQSAAGTLSDFLSKLDLRVSPLEENQRTIVCRVQAAYASWTRAARRGRHGREVPPTEKGHAILLACDLALDLVEKDNKVLVQFKAVWVRGLDRQAFESFFSSCVRKLASAKPVLSRQMVPDTSRKRKREAE